MRQQVSFPINSSFCFSKLLQFSLPLDWRSVSRKAGWYSCSGTSKCICVRIISKVPCHSQLQDVTLLPNGPLAKIPFPSSNRVAPRNRIRLRPFPLRFCNGVIMKDTTRLSLPPLYNVCKTCLLRSIASFSPTLPISLSAYRNLLLTHPP